MFENGTDFERMLLIAYFCVSFILWYCSAIERFCDPLHTPVICLGHLSRTLVFVILL